MKGDDAESKHSEPGLGLLINKGSSWSLGERECLGLGRPGSREDPRRKGLIHEHPLR